MAARHWTSGPGTVPFRAKPVRLVCASAGELTGPNRNRPHVQQFSRPDNHHHPEVSMSWKPRYLKRRWS